LGERFSAFGAQENIRLHLSSDGNDFADYDIIFRSPGFPLFKENVMKARDLGVEISSAMKLFF
jgi:UDP-N-acetylmuramoylalanine-D-glutamate ligase